MTIESLLPPPDEAPRCSVFASQIGLNPSGSAIRADQVLVVDVPLPWPSPVKTHPLLEGLMDVAGSSRVPTRLLAAVPHGGGELTIRRFIRSGATTERTDYRVPMNGLASLVALIAGEDPAADDHRVAAGPPDTVLVCTQGSHDLCCGTDGLRLFRSAVDRFAGVELLRVSHLGGHRFAPTAMTLPDGRMWANLDLDMLGAILDRTGDPVELATKCRGWWGADKGPAQVAEVTLFADLGWRLDDMDRRVTVTEEADGISTVEIRTRDLAFVVDVVAAREVPTIACRSAGGLPFKPAVEYRALPR